MNHQIRTRHGRAHRPGLRDIARNQRGAKRSEVARRHAVRTPDQRIQLPATVSDSPCERLPDKARAAGEKDAHSLSSILTQYAAAPCSLSITSLARASARRPRALLSLCKTPTIATRL